MKQWVNRGGALVSSPTAPPEGYWEAVPERMPSKMNAQRGDRMFHMIEGRFIELRWRWGRWERTSQPPMTAKSAAAFLKHLGADGTTGVHDVKIEPGTGRIEREGPIH